MKVSESKDFGIRVHVVPSSPDASIKKKQVTMLQLKVSLLNHKTVLKDLKLKIPKNFRIPQRTMKIGPLK